MRYAPTPVRLRFGLDWGMGELRFRSLQGVCDTPLHLFDENERLSNKNIMSNQPKTVGAQRHTPSMVEKKRVYQTFFSLIHPHAMNR